jgi:hypothetical protein
MVSAAARSASPRGLQGRRGMIAPAVIHELAGDLEVQLCHLSVGERGTLFVLLLALVIDEVAPSERAEFRAAIDAGLTAYLTEMAKP